MSAKTEALNMWPIPENSLQKDPVIDQNAEAIAQVVVGIVTINLIADANYTLLPADYLCNVATIADTGIVLTGPVDLIYPALFPRQTVINATAQTLTLKMTGQTGITLAASAKVEIVAGADDVITASDASSGGITALTGDVTASGTGSVAATLATAQPAVHTWALAQTFTVAPVFTDQSGSRTALGLGTAAVKAADTDTTLAANSDANLPTQKAVKTYVDGLIAASDAVVYKGATDCSANPNYPAADAGHLYVVSVAGKIGGASGITVEAGDMFICKVDSTASGNQATVGANWNVIQTNFTYVPTDAAVVPSTVPSAGQILSGNAGGTAYAPVSMSGDATLASTGALTVAAGAVTYAKMQDVSATKRVIGRNTAGSGDPEEVTLSQLLDWVGSAADGDILYRNGGAWTRLAAGTNGYVLTLASGLPSWAAAGGGGGSGDFVGPASSTDNAIVRMDGTTGKLGQNSSLTVSDLASNLLTVAIPDNAATTGASQAGNALTLTASNAVASTDTNGAAAGGELTVQGGVAARRTSGNADGGAVRLKPGAGIGTGVVGQVLLDDDGTEARPALAWDIGGNKAYGLWYSSGSINISVNGSRRVGFDGSGIKMYGGGNIVGDASTPGVFYGFKRQRFDLSSSTTLTSGSYNGSTLTNSTAAAAITSTLILAAAGYNHTFIDDNATYRWTIKPNTGDTIIWTDGTVVSATGSIVSTARYDAFDVEALDATVWLARNVRGTFTVTA